jgi:hypothetical protein
MSVITDCLDNAGEWDIDLCGDDLEPGISAIALIGFDYTITDFETAGQWTTDITSGEVKIVRDGKGAYNVTPAKVDNPRANGADQKLQKLQHVLTFEAPGVTANNDDFLAAVNGRNTYVAWYNTKTQQIMVVTDYTATIVATPAKDDMGANFQTYMIEISWQTPPSGFPSRLNAPAGIFE